MKNDENRKRLKSILLFFGIFVAIGFVVISIYGVSLKAASISMVWMLACVVAGSAIGFLFGIPKIMQPISKIDNPSVSSGENDQPRDGDYKLLVNTNLTEISDWLTKIIVGLGLVNLTKLPPYINSIAHALSNGIGDKENDSALAFSYGLITCYTVLGFLFGYLFTRLVLSQAFADADRASIRRVQEVLSSQSILLANLESKQGFITQKMYSETERDEKMIAAQKNANTVEEHLAVLNEMANAYKEITSADWAERTRLKNIAANEMADYCLKNSVPKVAIFQKYKAEKNEGIALALVGLINIKPEKGDIEMVLAVGPEIKRLNVRYRLLLALVTLHKSGLIGEREKVEAINIVESYKKDADPSLLKMIDSTLTVLNS